MFGTGRAYTVISARTGSMPVPSSALVQAGEARWRSYAHGRIMPRTRTATQEKYSPSTATSLSFYLSWRGPFYPADGDGLRCEDRKLPALEKREGEGKMGGCHPGRDADATVPQVFGECSGRGFPLTSQRDPVGTD